MFSRRSTRLSTQRMGRGLLFDSVLSLEDSTHGNDTILATSLLQDLDFQSILSKLQLSFFSADKQPSTKKPKRIEPPKSEVSVQKYNTIPREMFTKQLRKQEEEFLIEHRHDSAELQHEYDKRFGLVLK